MQDNKARQKKPGYQASRDVSRAENVKITAKLRGVSQDYVRKVLRGDRDDAKTLSIYMELTEGKTLLVKAVEQLVPFL